MKILLIGATGQTGQQVLPLLLQAGYTVTVMARNPGAFATKHTTLRVIPGDVRQAEAIEAAVEGQDAVMSCYGSRSLKRDDVHELFFTHLIDAMHKHGVKRLVSLSAWGAGGSAHEVPLLFKLFRNTLLRHVYADKNRAEALVDESDLLYTHVRPGRLLNAPARGGVRAAPTGAGLKGVMTRADLAVFMVAQLTDSTWVRKAPVIGY